jgi:hypothetical protein
MCRFFLLWFTISKDLPSFTKTRESFQKTDMISRFFGGQSGHVFWFEILAGLCLTPNNGNY